MALLGRAAAARGVIRRAGASVMLLDPARRQRLRASTGARIVALRTSFFTRAWSLRSVLSFRLPTLVSRAGRRRPRLRIKVLVFVLLVPRRRVPPGVVDAGSVSPVAAGTPTVCFVTVSPTISTVARRCSAFPRPASDRPPVAVDDRAAIRAAEVIVIASGIHVNNVTGCDVGARGGAHPMPAEHQSQQVAALSYHCDTCGTAMAPMTAAIRRHDRVPVATE